MESSAELSSEEMDLDLENVGDQNDSKNSKILKREKIRYFGTLLSPVPLDVLIKC